MTSYLFLTLTFAAINALRYDHEDQLLQKVKEIKKAKANSGYSPKWISLDGRPLPQWFDQAKIGILIHWGVYSVPAFGSEWFWKDWMDTPPQAYDDKYVMFIENEYSNRDIKYNDLADLLKAEHYNPDDIALSLKQAGARYVILSAKHYDGFSMFNSMQAPDWNCKDRGPRRDVMAELSLSVKKQNMAFGVQYSLAEWYNIWYLNDKEDNFNNSIYPSYRVFPELKDIVMKYSPSIIRAQGDSEAPVSYWRPEKFLSWLYGSSPVRTDVVVNDRWGYDTRHKHGDYYSFVNVSYPKTSSKHKWEVVIPLDTKSWGYRRDMVWKDIQSLKKIVRIIIHAVSRGGNVLLNIGLTKSGKIPKMFKKQLSYLGEYLNVNGEAIYNTSPWIHNSDPYNKDAKYTCLRDQYNAQYPTDNLQITERVSTIYTLFTRWPKNNKMVLEGIAPIFRNDTYVTVLLGQTNQGLHWKWIKGKIVIQLPTNFTTAKLSYDIGWALKFTRVTGAPIKGHIVDANHTGHDWEVDMAYNTKPLRTSPPPVTFKKDNFVRLIRD